MALIRCSECGKEISDKAAACPNCGAPVIVPRAGTNQTIAVQTKATTQQQSSSVSRAQTTKKVVSKYEGRNSGMSIVALILSIIGCTFFIGIILAIIDLTKQDGRKKTVSIIAIVISCLWILVAIGSSSSDSSKSTSSSNAIKTESTEKPKVDKNISTGSSKATTQKETPKPAEKSDLTRDQVLARSQPFVYKDIMRNPDDYLGKYFYVDVKIFTAETGSLFSGYDRAYKAFLNDEYDLWMGDMIYLMDNRDTNSSDYIKILEDDIVRVYGRFDGLVETMNYLNNTKGEEVALQILYVELISG